MSQPTTPSPARPVPAEPTHHCVRCGAEIPIGDALCRSCNPAGLKQPAASQAHGTVFLGIALAVVGMAVVATFFLGGVGPFPASIRAAVPDGGGIVLTLAVDNTGTRAGHASCRVWDPTYLANPPIETFVRTPEIEPGGSIVFDQRITALGTTVRPFAVSCSR